MGLKVKGNNGELKVFYNGSELLGYATNVAGMLYAYTPRQMRAFHLAYERLLRDGKYEQAKEIEVKKALPETWLNGVISDLVDESINNGCGLARKLVEAFRERGYSEIWMQKSLTKKNCLEE